MSRIPEKLISIAPNAALLIVAQSNVQMYSNDQPLGERCPHRHCHPQSVYDTDANAVDRIKAHVHCSRREDDSNGQEFEGVGPAWVELMTSDPENDRIDYDEKE